MHRSYQCGRRLDQGWVTTFNMYIREGVVASTLKDSMYLHHVQLQVPICQHYGPRINRYNKGKQLNKCKHLFFNET